MKHFALGDPGDLHDTTKWNFNESTLQKTLGKDGYTYLVNNPKHTEHLQQIRNNVNLIIQHISQNFNTYTQEEQQGLQILIDIHAEQYLPQQEFLKMSKEFKDYFGHHWMATRGMTSKVIYSEIPPNTGFKGLNKPKQRTILNNHPHVGKDKNLRSIWRHIFFKLPANMSLVLHEIAHTAANHNQWRPDDHGDDFKMFETIVKDAWKKIIIHNK